MLQIDDVILGVGGQSFQDDARKSFAAAIQDAEKESNGGLLEVTRWRAGKAEEVQLKLRVMSLDDVQALAPDIYAAVKTPSPSATRSAWEASRR